MQNFHEDHATLLTVSDQRQLLLIVTEMAVWMDGHPRFLDLFRVAQYATATLRYAKSTLQLRYKK